MVRDDEAVAQVQAAYQDFQRGDIGSLLSRLTDDISWYTPGEGTAIPFAGQRNGKAAVAAFFESVESTLEFHSFDPNEFISQGDVVVALGTWDATVRGTSARIADGFAMVFRLRDGKVAEFREYSDSRPIAEAFASLKK
ncbi:MAG: nuclear transport factor 2 family protein [Candidatus Eremiobacteraeota bacterium]|nr:nuclear transport factor 2 family protein [Candidatus Eremiobacteraeota bacterium]